MHLFFDIETVPTQREDIIKLITLDEQSATESEALRIQQQYKKPETIHAHLQELAAGLPGRIDEALRSTSLDGAYGEILCLGYAFDDGPVQVLSRTLAESESTLIQQFFEELPAPSQEGIIWVGHNIQDFGLRFLWQRVVIHQIKIPLTLPVNDRPGMCFDTMTEWAGRYNRAKKWPSLDKLCRVFKISSPKAKMDGSKVWDMAKAGRYAEIEAYCKLDVEAVRKIHAAMTS